MRCVYGSNLWNMFTGRVYGCYFGTHFTRSYCMSILGVMCFGLSFQSNIWIDYTRCVYGLSLWDRFTCGVCDSSVGAEFTDQVYKSSLLVVFSGWLCRFSTWVDFIDEFTGLVYGHMSWVYKSRLWVLFYRSHLMVTFDGHLMSFKIEVTVRD